MERKLTAILAADVAGYSRLMQLDEEGTLTALRSHREVVHGVIGDHRGRLFSATSDGIVAEFSSAIAAINCAVDFQQELAERNESRAQDRRLEFRIGLNIGEVIVEHPSVYGAGVELAAYLQGLAEPGGICAARNVYVEVRHKVGATFEALGRHRFKDLAEPVFVYRVLVGSTVATSRMSKWLHTIKQHGWGRLR
jgi:adenylate cyclase